MTPIPTTANDLLKETLKRYKVSACAAAVGARLPNKTVYSLITDDNPRRFTAKTDLLLCAYFGLKPGTFLYQQTTYELFVTELMLREDLLKINIFNTIRGKTNVAD